MHDVAQVFFEDMEVGMTAAVSKVLDDAAVRAFAALSGDVNPVHLDDDYAATTLFGRRIAHGMFTAALLSTVIGTRLPGKGTIYLSQTLRFRRPVFIGDEVTAEVEVTVIDQKRQRVTLACRCIANGKEVLSGEAVVMPPSRERGA